MIIGKIWNSPNTLVGLIFGAMGKIALGKKCRIHIGHNAIEFYGNPFLPSKAEGVTLGNVICYRDNEPLPEVPIHEQQHTIQGEVLGPFYLPLHVICLVFWHRMDNFRNSPLERGPYHKPNPRPW